VLTLFALAGCQAGGIAVAVPTIVAPSAVTAEVSFGDVALVPVGVENIGTASAYVGLTVSAPFSLPSPQLVLAPGQVGSVSVVVQPTGYADVAGVLTLMTDAQRLDVAVRTIVDGDGDGDGHAAIGAGGDDCDDDAPGVHPGALETCNGTDDDCDGLIDDDALVATWYLDADHDAIGGDNDLQACQPPSSDYVAETGDCDDHDPEAYPGAPETWYDGVDQDCDGASDFDRDEDGYENAGNGGDDCVDSNASIHPGAEEIWYDGVDQDCDGASDGDADGDGYDAYVVGGPDCDDADPGVAPDMPEADDGVDQDCDVWVDEDFLARGDLVFTEILFDPAAVSNVDGQYVELWNGSSRTVSLAGLVLLTPIDAVALPAVSVPPGGAVVACSNTSSAANGGVTCAATLPASLAAGAVELWVDVRLDEVDGSSWSASPGAAWELSADHLDPDDNDLASQWCAASSAFGDGDLGTPGAVGAPCQSAIDDSPRLASPTAP
jgi:hypothetical protein